MKRKSTTHTSKSAKRGFTLIELLTAISIIATLSAVAFPAINAAMELAKMNAAMQSARQVALGLRAYANDSGGIFPAGQNDAGDSISTSNAAFRDLEDYVDDERVYAVPGSAWGAEAKNSKPYCSPGECHWSYVSGLSTSSTSWFPLVVDGTDGSGKYTRKRGQRGGLWKGKKAIVANVDGSASTVRLKGEGDSRYLPRQDEDDADALQVEAYMDAGAELLDPEA